MLGVRNYDSTHYRLINSKSLGPNFFAVCSVKLRSLSCGVAYCGFTAMVLDTLPPQQSVMEYVPLLLIVTLHELLHVVVIFPIVTVPVAIAEELERAMPNPIAKSNAVLTLENAILLTLLFDTADATSSRQWLYIIPGNNLSIRGWIVARKKWPSIS